MLKARLGFTLIEALTTVSIIGILITIGGSLYLSALQSSRDSTRKGDLERTRQALEQYYQDNRQYPVFEHSAGWVLVARWQLANNFTNDGYCAHSAAGKRYLAPEYMTEIPEDPLSRLSFGEASDCASVNSQAGQYLYASLPDSSGSNGSTASVPANGFYLIARMERTHNINLTQAIFSGSSYYQEGLNTASLSLPGTHNYVIKNSRNN